MQGNMMYFNWRSRPKWWLPMVVVIPVMLVGFVLVGIAGYQMVQQQGYQAGQCTITGKQLLHELSTTTHTNHNGNTTTTTTSTQVVYAPSFQFSVRTADGKSYAASGYDGTGTFTSDRAGQQAVVDQYSIGQSYPCWYNAANPTQAVLARHLNWVLILVGGIFIVVSLFILIVWVVIARAGGQNTGQWNAGFGDSAPPIYQDDVWNEEGSSSTFQDDAWEEEGSSSTFQDDAGEEESPPSTYQDDGSDASPSTYQDDGGGEVSYSAYKDDGGEEWRSQ